MKLDESWQNPKGELKSRLQICVLHLLFHYLFALVLRSQKTCTSYSFDLLLSLNNKHHVLELIPLHFSNESEPLD